MFQPSALSNPALQRVTTTQLPVAPSVRRSDTVEEIVNKVTDKKEESEGLSMPVKVAIGVGVAGALGFLVYSLIK
jgi:hypothetical protein